MYFPNKEITIEVTNKCGAKCIMCPREKMKQNLEVMPFDVYKKTVDDAFSCGVELIDLCGYGDVFLDRNLMEKVKYTKEINPNFILFHLMLNDEIHFMNIVENNDFIFIIPAI